MVVAELQLLDEGSASSLSSGRPPMPPALSMADQSDRDSSPRFVVCSGQSIYKELEQVNQMAVYYVYALRIIVTDASVFCLNILNLHMLLSFGVACGTMFS